MARKGENIYKRKDGRWEGRIRLVYSDNKKIKYHSLYAKSYLELKNKMRSYDDREKEKEKVKDNTIFMDTALQIWLEERKYNWKQSTYACYKQIVEVQISPIIGRIPLSQFNTTALNVFISKKKLEKDRVVSDSYLKNMINVILQTLRYFKNEYGYEIIIPSVRTKQEKSKDKILPSEQTLKILDSYLIEHCEDSTCLGILLCRYTGLRIGELCALQWKDIDTEKGIIHIARTLQRVNSYEQDEKKSKIIITVPKTKQSNRVIPLPATIRELLKIHRKEDLDYLVKGKKMPYAEPRTIQYRFHGILKKCNLTIFNFHMLRHLFATKCIAIGFDINSLSELLGHANVQITMNLYVHSSNKRKHFLMEQFEL